ncbi:2-oxoglutarate-Fe(II) type oxidoreductase [Lachnellula willkommii]|uniref:2-oxoglutarate-Fe(II) type oxidoreductase n=1 Tax=Lachnellula willkommii TaxID=215461 RepID=A0A559MKF6_9HELO|nr:2-oxoglutarate-Fe(II) type oxidoreductase [Lachnellula willkommii]
MTLTEEEPPRPGTIRLQNGQVLDVKSDSGRKMDSLPVIDVSGMYSDNFEHRKAVAERVRTAAHEIGFFYAINHGVDLRYPKNTFEQAKLFFELPTEKKMEVFTDLVPNEYVGYHPLEHYSRSGHLCEAFNWAYDAKFDPETLDPNEPSINIWPTGVPNFKETLFQHHTQMLSFSRRMTRIFALALHLPEDAFDMYIQRPEAGMRILHYPQQEAAEEDQNGIGAHTDFECFTTVTQDDCGGLEVLSKGGEWIQAKPIPGAFVVNIADCFMRQTNDFFVSTVHRVINKSGKERYSCPFFFGFDRKKVLEAVPTCVSESNPMKYPIMTAGEYYAWRANKAKSQSGEY